MSITLAIRAARFPAFRRRCAGLVWGLCAVLLAACGGDDGGDARVTVGTGPGGTLYNQMGVAVTNILQRELGLKSTARPYTGSSVYLPIIQRGEMEFAVNLSVDLQAAYSGSEPYSAAMPDLRLALLLTRAPFQYYVRGDSGIESLEQLAGRPVVTEFRSLASFKRVNEAALGTGGIALDEVEPVVVAGVPDAIRALAENRVDAAGTVLGIPALREAHATLRGGIRILPLGPHEEALAAVPGMGSMVLQPGPAYVGIDEPTRVAQFEVYLATHEGLDAERVYQVVRTVHQGWADLQEALPALRGVSAGELLPPRILVPYHAGAVRYFREAGLWTAAHETQQRELLGQP